MKGLDDLSLLANSSDPTKFRNFTPDIEGKKKQFKGVQDVIQKTIQRLLEQQAKDTTRHFYCKQQIQLAAQALTAADVRLGELAAANQSLTAAYALASSDSEEFAAAVAEVKAAATAVLAAKKELADFYAKQPGGAVTMGSIVDLLDGLHARLLTSASTVEAGEAKEQAAFVEADRTRQVALAEATKSEEHATADALAASSALPSTQEEAAAVAEAQNKTAERQRILEEVCEHAPASATEVAALKDLYKEITGDPYPGTALLQQELEPAAAEAATDVAPAVDRLTAVRTEIETELGEATSAYEAEKTRCDTEQDEVAAALAESEDDSQAMAQSASAAHAGAAAKAQVEHDSKALAEMRTSLEKMETMREEEHASFVAEEKELASAVATVDAALAQMGNATLVQQALNLRKVPQLALVFSKAPKGLALATQSTDLSPGSAQVKGVLMGLRDSLEDLRATKLESIDALAAQVAAQTEAAVTAKGSAQDAKAELRACAPRRRRRGTARSRSRTSA